MKNILSQRPTKFKSVEEAIQWQYVVPSRVLGRCSYDLSHSISSGAVRNLESARVSVPSLLVPQPGRAEGSQDVVWRTDLVATAPYWEGMCCAAILLQNLTCHLCRVVLAPLFQFPGGKSREALGTRRAGAAGP